MRDTKHFRLDDPWFFESELVDLRGRLEQVRASISAVEGYTGSISVDTARITPPWEQDSARSAILLERISSVLMIFAAAMISCGLVLFFAALFVSRTQLWTYSFPTLFLGVVGICTWALLQLWIRRSQMLPMIEIERLRQLHSPESEGFEPLDFSREEAE